jgi:hypothetical protein
MTQTGIQDLIDSMDPHEAAQELAGAARKLFSLLGEDALRDFLTNLIGDGGRDKITGLVHL